MVLNVTRGECRPQSRVKGVGVGRKSRSMETRSRDTRNNKTSDLRGKEPKMVWGGSIGGEEKVRERGKKETTKIPEKESRERGTGGGTWKEHERGRKNHDNSDE